MREDRTAATSQHTPVKILVLFVLLQLEKQRATKKIQLSMCLPVFFNVQNKIALRFPAHMSECEPTRNFQGLVINFQNRGEENGDNR